MRKKIEHHLARYHQAEIESELRAAGTIVIDGTRVPDRRVREIAVEIDRRRKPKTLRTHSALRGGIR